MTTNERGIWSKLSQGPEEKPVLLMVMGYAGSSFDWGQEFLSEVQKNFRTLIFDARGTGQSIRPEEVEQYQLNEQLADIESVLNTHKVRDFYLFGYSYGGAIGHLFAKLNEERILGIAYASTSAGAEHYVSPEVDVILRLAKPAGKSAFEKSTSIWRACLGEAKLQRHLPALKECFDALGDRHPKPLATREQLRIFGAFEMKPFDCVKNVLVFHGKEDPLTPVENARLVEMEDVAHMPHIEAPRELAAGLGLLLEPSTSTFVSD